MGCNFIEWILFEQLFCYLFDKYESMKENKTDKQRETKRNNKYLSRLFRISFVLFLTLTRNFLLLFFCKTKDMSFSVLSFITYLYFSLSLIFFICYNKKHDEKIK